MKIKVKGQHLVNHTGEFMPPYVKEDDIVIVDHKYGDPEIGSAKNFDWNNGRDADSFTGVTKFAIVTDVELT